MPSDPIVHVIDDDDAARDSLAFLLQTSGFKVRTYESAVTFLDQITHAESGCIISDMRMPGLTGLDLLRRLQDRGIDQGRRQGFHRKAISPRRAAGRREIRFDGG